MPNEFVAKNGIIAQNNSVVSGSLIVTNGITGSLFGTSSQAVSASFAVNYLGSGSISTRLTNTETTASNLVAASSSFSTRITSDSSSFSSRVSSLEATTASLQVASSSFSIRITNTETTASNLVAASSSFSSRVSSIEATTASLQVASGSFSTRVTQIERTYATTGSNIYTGSQNILGAVTASAALINGTLTAQTLVVTTVSSSVVFSSGSNIFGNSTANTQTMTGSLNVSGSATIIGRVTAMDLTGSLFGTASWATNFITASVTSASYAFTASSAISSSLSQTASFSLRGSGSFTGSFSGSVTASLFGTASQAITASYAINAANAFIQGGNSFGTTATIGTNDAQALSLETNAISRIQVLNDGNIRVQPTASMRPFMDGMYVETHPEGDNPAIIPYLGNDIAYNTLRGGTFTGTPGPGSTVVTSAATAEAMFDGAPTYAFFNSTDLSGSYTASITFPQSYNYGNTIGFSFGNAGWRARNFTVEILVTGSYYTLDTVTNWQYSSYNKSFNYAEQAVQGAKITFSNFNSTGFRVADIYLINYNSIYGKGIYVGRDGGQIYKGITVTGSVVVTSGGFTGSLFGTASQAVTSSFALRGNGSFTGSFSGSVTASLFGTASQATSASYAFTASSATNAFQAVSSSFATTASTVIATVTGTNSTELVRGNMADNDQFRILVGGTATNAGFAEIATADDGTEPIHVRQYTGVFASLVRTATLLDGSGNTSFPGTVSATFSGNLTGTASFATSYLGSGSISTRLTNLETASANLTTASGSFSTRVTNTETTASNLVAASASFSTRITSDSSSFSSRVSSIEATTASLQVASGSFSTRVTQIERTYATTGSNIYTGSQNILGAITASAALINGTITAQTLVVTTVSSSVVFSSGSNIFGNSTANTQTMTGSLNVSGSATIVGRVTATDLTGSLFGTASQALTASYVLAAGVVGLNLSLISTGSVSASVGQSTSSFQVVSGSVNLFYVSSSGNIGVGTVAPRARVHASGSNTGIIGDANDNFFGNYTAGDYIDIGHLGAVGSVFLDTRGTSTNVNLGYRTKGTGNHIWTYAGGTVETMRIVGGNVGVGAANPSAIVHISGSDTGSLFRISSHTSSSLFFVSGSGNVGIGTITPEFKLDVSGSGQARIGAAELGNWPSVTNYAFFGHERLDQTAAGNYALLQDSGGSTYVNASTGRFIALRINNITTATVESTRFTFTGSFGLSGSMLVTGSITGSLSGSVTGSLFGTASQAVSSSYALTASFALNGGGGVSFPYTGSAQITGSLGVTGSFSVSANQGSSVFSSNADTLLITGSLIITGSGAAITGSLNVSNGITGSLFGTASQAVTASYALTASYVASIAGLSTSQIATGSITASVSLGSGSFAVTSGSSTFLFVSSSGNVGFGTTTNLNDRLTVLGNATIGRSNTTSQVYIGLGTPGTVTPSSLFWSFGLLANSNDFNIQSYDGTTLSSRLRIDTSGRVGIGTNTPSASLDVSGSVRITNGLSETGSVNISGSLTVTGSITTNGTITAQTLVVQTITSSITYSSGSNIFGSALTNTQTMTGSVNITGSMTLRGNEIISGSSTITGSLTVSSGITGSLFGTASQAISASLSQTASFALRGSGSFTGSFSGSFTGSLFGTASQALTASYAMGGSASSILFQTASAATTWSFNHFLQTQYPVFTIYDEGNNVIVPQQITAVDTSSALIYFSSPKRGVAVASKGGYSASVVTSATTANTAITASYALLALSASNAPGFTFTFSQSLAAVTWSINHNMNTRTPLVQVYDINYNQLIPNQVVSVTQNLTEVRFDYGQNGYAVLSSGMAPFVTGSTSLLNQTTPALTWSFAHNLNTKYVNFEVYDSTDYTMIPSAIRVIDTNNAEIHMAYPTTGRAVANFSGINGQMNAQTASLALTASFVRPLSQSVAITGSGTTNSTLDITGIRTNSAVNPPVGTISLYYPGADGATANVHGASIMFSQRYDAASAVPIGIGMIAGVKVNSGGNFGGGLTFWTSNQTNNNLVERMRIDASGSVGIGLTSPRALLHISGSSLSASLFQVSSTSNNNALVVSGSGNVGVSKANPAATLDVSGSMLVTGSYAMSGSFTQVGYKILTTVSQSLNYADDTAAAAGGVPLGGLYRNGNFILIRLS